MSKQNYMELLENYKGPVKTILEESSSILSDLNSISCESSEAEIKSLQKELTKNKDSFEKVPLEIKHYHGKPAQVIALCGPGKAGKSTVFNLISGFSTFRGYDKSTMSSLAIFPKQGESDDTNIIGTSANLFPNFAIKALNDKEDVLKEGEPADRLFVSSYESKDHNIHSILLDLPDFDSIKETNWEKAKKGISRADTVIFTVSVEKSRNMFVYNLMQEVLTLSGSFIYLLTKIDPEKESPTEEDYRNAATRIRNNLLEEVKKKEEFTTSYHTNGKSLATILEECPFYYSRNRSVPALEDIKPLINSQGNFSDYLFNGSIDTIFESKHHKLHSASIKSKELCQNLKVQLQKSLDFILDAEGITQKAAEDFVGKADSWPVPHIFTILRDELNKSRASVIVNLEKGISFCMSYLSLMVKKTKDSLKAQFTDNSFTFNSSDINNKLAINAENCLRDISTSKYATRQQQLDPATRDTFVKAFEETEPPYLGEWKEKVRKDINGWIEKQRIELKQRQQELAAQKALIPIEDPDDGSFFCKFKKILKAPLYILKPFKDILSWITTRNKLGWLEILNKCYDIFIPLGILLFIIDIFVDGGLGQFGLITVIGACPALTCAISNFLGQLISAIGLSEIAKNAQICWKEKSTEAYRDFLWTQLIEPSFKFNTISKEKLENSLSHIDNCYAANEKLENLLSESEELE